MLGKKQMILVSLALIGGGSLLCALTQSIGPAIAGRVEQIDKSRKILVRYMNYGEQGEGLRISVGTDADVSRLLDELRGMV